MPDEPRPTGEFGLIERFRARSSPHQRVPIGIGDDCASIRFAPGAEVLVTTDMLMDGRHFRVDRDDPRAIGHKCLGVNLSDIAAMAGRPVAAVVAVALPRTGAVDLAMGLHDGMSRLADRFGLAIVGGDTNAWDGPLVVSVTVLGEATARGAVRRSGARPGDVVCVTGPLGGSILGRHLAPIPRIAEAIAIHEAVPIHAMIDLSDGLAGDLAHILDESGGLGADLDLPPEAIHPDAVPLSARDGLPPIDHALRDGEDFELCLTLGPDDWSRADRDPPPGVRLIRVGTIEARPGLRLRGVPYKHGGFDHLKAEG